MSETTLILLGAGSSSRFKDSVKKQWLLSGDQPLWLHVANNFNSTNKFSKIIIVSSSEDIKFMRKFCSYELVKGGSSRQESLKNGLQNVTSKYVMVSDIARCCTPLSLIDKLLEHKEQAKCIVPTLKMKDTVYLNEQPLNRDDVKIIQTPQISETQILTKALNTDIEFTDDSSAISNLGYKVMFIDGDEDAHKLTTISDLKKLKCIKPTSQKQLIGFGIDTHAFEPNKPMYLGGVNIESSVGFKAHSDGDVAIHAIIDALLGAAGLGDIGELYPDNDDNYNNIDSKILLKDSVSKLKSYGYIIENVDITIIAQTPKISPHKNEMQDTLSNILEIRKNFINIKATTSEQLGFIGRNEGITVHAVANLTYKNWENI